MTADTILLDLDGTLIESTYHLAVAWHQAFEQCEVRVPLWRIHRSIGMGGDRLVAEVADDAVEQRDGDRIRDLWKSAYDEMLPDVTTVPGAAELVRHLDDIGLQVAIASSGKPDHTQHAIDLLGVGDLLAAVTTGDDAAQSKPAGDILQTALDQAGGTTAIVLGDSPYDVHAAHDLGFECVTVRTGGFGRDELEEAGTIHVAESLEELIDLDWHQL